MFERLDLSPYTNIGDMTGGNGAGAAFDNNFSTYAGGTSATYRWTGKNLGANTRSVAYVICNGVPGFGYRQTAGSVGLILLGKQGVPANSFDGTVLGSVELFTNVTTANPKTIESSDQTTKWQCIWVTLQMSPNAANYMAEVEVFQRV